MCENHLSNCAAQARPPAAAQFEGVGEFGEPAHEASRRGRPELSDKVIESGDSTDSLLPMRWVEFSWKESRSRMDFMHSNAYGFVWSS